jgi:hypothetical protein
MKRVEIFRCIIIFSTSGRNGRDESHLAEIVK